MSDTLIAPQTTDPDLEHAEPIYAHIVAPDKDHTAHERVMTARIEGTTIEALCGHVWVPSRDPQRHPLCPLCEEIAKANLHNPDGGPPDLGRIKG